MPTLPDPHLLRDLAALARAIDRADFGMRVLDVVSHVCRLRNFGVFVIADPARPDPVMSLFAGDLGEYRIRRNARESTAQPGYPARLAALVAAARVNDSAFEHHAPGPDDPRWPIYRRSGLIEHIACLRIDRGMVYNVNYYRSAADGPITTREEADLRLLLPLVNDLVVARQKLVGVESLPSAATGRVLRLRERRRPGFVDLSPREAELLDMIAAGQTVAGAALTLSVSENTARTLRARAYRKLGIDSKGQLFTLLLADAERSGP